MGGFFAAVAKFATAIFFGAGAGASAAYVFAVNVARLGVVALTARLAAPKLDFSEKARRKTVTLRDTTAYQQFIYGEDMVSGPIIFANVAGNSNVDLYYMIAFAGHEVDSAQAYRLDSTDITLAQLSGSEDGTVDSGKYANAMEIELLHGDSAQAASTLLTAAFGSNWTSSHTARGWATMVFKMSVNTTNENAFKNGAPRNFRIRVRGKKIYDPRLDSTNGGSGPHRLANESTWEWSENPALCLADWLRDDKFGMAEEDDRIDWPKVITAADVCEETVSTPGGNQDRYTCNGTFSARSSRRSIRDSLVNAMMGRLVFSQGTWQMWAGEAVTADVTLTEANLAGSIQLQAAASSKDRYNRVRGKFVDKDRDYTAAMYPEVRSSAYESDDGGEVRELVADFQTVQDQYEAQRNAIITLRRSRNQRVMVFEGNYSCFRIQPGATVDVSIAELGFSGEKFFVTEWKFGRNGINLTLVEEDDTVWNDPANSDYTTRSATGVLSFADIGVPAPTSLTATALFGGVQLDWTNPPIYTFAVIEIWASDDNDRNNAVKIGETTDNTYIEYIDPVARRPRYYWVRARNGSGETSDYEPNLTTTTATTNQRDPNTFWIGDSEFDTADALSDTPLWNTVEIQGTSPSQTGSVGITTGVGVDSSNVVDFVPSLGGGSRIGIAQGAPARSALKNKYAVFSVTIRYRTIGSADSNDHEGVKIGVNYNTVGTPGTLVGTSEEVTLPRESDWNEYTVQIRIGTPPLNDALKTVGFIMEVTGSSGTADTLRVDSMQVQYVGNKFGDIDDGASGLAIGLVPPAPSADAGKFLKGDGTWGDPAGGSGPAGTTDGAIQTWSTAVSPDAWVENLRVRVVSGALRVYDASGADYLGIDHDGTDINIAGVGTTDINITGITEISAGTVDVDFDVGTFSQLNVDGGQLAVQSGNALRILNSINTDWVDFSHDGTDFNIAATNTTDLNITGIAALVVANYNFDVNQTVGAGQDNYVLTYDHGDGQISLEAADPGDVSVIRFSGTDVLEAVADGQIELRANISKTGNFQDTDIFTALIVFTDDDDSHVAGTVGYSGSSTLQLRSDVRGGFVRVQGINSSGGLQTAFTFDPDAPATSFANPANFQAGNTAEPSFNIAEGVAPSSPVDGDVWITAAGAFNARLNGSTVDLAAGGGLSGSANETVTGQWTFESRVDIDNAAGIRIHNSTDSDYVTINHDGSNLNLTPVNTAALVLQDGLDLDMWDATDTDLFRIVNNGAGVNFAFVNLSYIAMQDGVELRVQDSADTDYIRILHDGSGAIIGTPSGDGDISIEREGVEVLATQDHDATGNTSGAQVKDHGGTMRDIGFNVAPEFNNDTSDTLEARHNGSFQMKDNSGAVTLTLEASGSTDFPVNGVTHVFNASTSDNYNINEGSGTTLRLYVPGTGDVDTTGGITLEAGGYCTIWRRNTTTYYCWGAGITYTP